MKRIALFKLGRIVTDEKILSVSAAEIIGSALQLKELGYEPTIFSHVKAPQVAKGIQILPLLGNETQLSSRYDGAMVFNGQLNFFVGQECPLTMASMRAFTKFTKPVLYVFVDPGTVRRLPFYSSECACKSWFKKYPENEYYGFWGKEVNVLTNFFDREKVQTFLQKNLAWKPREIFYHYFNSNCLWLNDYSPPTPGAWDVDLVYGGNFRGGHRQKDLAEYFFGLPDDILAEIFGAKMKIEKFKPKLVENLRPPVFEKPKKFPEYEQRLKQSLATVVIGDKWYFDNAMPARLIESALAGTVTLIDHKYDPRRVWLEGDPVLNYFSYVDSRAAVVQKVRRLKEDPAWRAEIVRSQYELWCKKSDYIFGVAAATAATFGAPCS